MDERLDRAPCGWLAFTDDGIVTAINRTLLDILDYRGEDVVGAHVERLLTIGSRIFYQTHLFPLLRLHGKADEIFIVLKRASGEDAAMLVNAARRERDGLWTTECVLIEVRERSKFEDALLRAKREAETARAAADENYRAVQHANELLVAQGQELSRREALLREQAEELEAQAEELEEQNVEMLRVNDALMHRGEELETMRRTAEAATRAKGDFLAMMSHELRTPLNAIGGYTELILMGVHGPVTDAQREALDRVARSQRHLLRLINEILNLSRLEAGHVEYDVQDVCVADVVDTVFPMVEPQVATASLRFTVDVARDVCVRADREKLEQILLNLLSNAVKFTPEGGEITLETRMPKPAYGLPATVQIRVRDTGIGIPVDRIASVFEPFVQVTQDRTRTREGTGLGLTISRDLARGMGGELTVTSEPGSGSTFIVELQRADG